MSLMNTTEALASDCPLARFARERPHEVALRLIPSDQRVTWRELEQRSRRCAAALQAAGLVPGDVVAIFLENHVRYFELLWGAQRAGLYYVTISRHLKQEEMQYIVSDSGARVVFCSAQTLAQVSVESLSNRGAICVSMDGPASGVMAYDAWVAGVAADVVLPDVPEGTDFCYSSGTTGVPKGIKRPLANANRYFNATPSPRMQWKSFDVNTVFLSTAPFYHTAPVRWNMAVLGSGGTCIMMEKFEPQAALVAIQTYGVTHAQWVPTMFVRLLRLPETVRLQYDVSSLCYAIHAAAPCPQHIKRQMIDWWGPVLYEFYSGTELVGRTSLDSHEWLAHPGSVGRPEFGEVHIVDDAGTPLPTGQSGVIYFSGGGRFEYHNDPDKTRQAYDARGWATYGDIGYLDDDGFLYLTDRVANTIVSGGVNIYPQEAENRLLAHPAVHDVAVVGVPNVEFGEEVRAVVQLRDPAQASADMAQALIAFCRDGMSHIKCPSGVDFVTELPRTDTGKLLKRLVKQRYWPDGVGIAK